MVWKSQIWSPTGLQRIPRVTSLIVLGTQLISAVGRRLGSTWGQKLSSGTPSTCSLPVVPENNRCSADRPRALGIKVLGSGAHKAPARGLRPKCVLSCSHHCAGDHRMGLTSASRWVVQGLGWGREVMGTTRLVSGPLSGTHPHAAGSLLSHLQLSSSVKWANNVSLLPPPSPAWTHTHCHAHTHTTHKDIRRNGLDIGHETAGKTSGATNSKLS